MQRCLKSDKYGAVQMSTPRGEHKKVEALAKWKVTVKGVGYVPETPVSWNYEEWPRLHRVELE